MLAKIYKIILLLFLTLYIQESSATDCSADVPENTVLILNSSIFHTTDPLRPFAIPGWTLIDADSQTYEYNSNQIGLEWDIFTDPGDCSPHYSVCPVAPIESDPEIEMNWIVTSYYVTEANNIVLRLHCTSLVEPFMIDCRTAIRAYYYESDQNLTDVSSLLNQFNPTQLSINEATDDGYIYFSFTKTESGFFIGFLNNIPCVNVDSFYFYYFECPAVTAVQYSLNATLAPNSTNEPIVIPLSCPVRSQLVTPALFQCYANGIWSLPDDSVDLCVCIPGAGYVNLSCSNCRINSYKLEPGDDMCIDCPLNSNTGGNTGATECICDVDWYRGVEEGVIESCGMSPSAVRNLRISRGVSQLVADWDVPTNLGNRNETSYRMDLYESITGSIATTEYIVSKTEYNLDSISDSTEYRIMVTSQNSINTVSGIYNSTSLTFLSSFPTISILTYSDNYLTWRFKLYAVSDYQFKLSYKRIGSGSTVVLNVNSSSCQTTGDYVRLCELQVSDLNISTDVVISLLNPSGPNSDVISQSFTLLITTPGLTLLMIIYIGIPIAACLLITLLLLVLISCCVICCKRRREYTIKPKDSEMIPLQSQLYQDPSLYEDLNKAVRALAKEIYPDEIEKDSIIGVGEFGDVWKGYLNRNNHKLPVALKILKPASTEKNKDDFFKEASVMGQFSHPNVIFLYGVTLKKPIMIVTPFMENGSLDKYLITNMNNIPFKELVAICYGVSRGMVYLSLLGYVHRDLAARNIILDKDLTPKITDFGLSRETEENYYRVQTGGKIPVRWTAPEAILYRKFNTTSDVWSFGVLIWEVMSFGQVPYGDTDNFTIMEELQKGYRLPAPDRCPSVIYNLMLNCWNDVPDNRPSFTNIQQSLLQIIETNKARPNSVMAKLNSQNPLNHTTLDSWLASLRLEKYALNFRENGYSQISSVWHMSDAELFKIGIIPAGHRNKIMTSIHRANSQLCFTYSVPL